MPAKNYLKKSEQKFLIKIIRKNINLKELGKKDNFINILPIN
jgi:hypothetical protein